MKYLIVIISLIVWMGCKNEASDKKATQKATADKEVQKTAEVASYPPLSADIFRTLVDSLTYLDIIIYHSDFSMSIDNRPGLEAFLSTFDTQQPDIKETCQPIGRIFLEHKGKELLQADLVYQNACTYYIFYKNGKKQYANKMNDNGIKYFNQVFQQAKSPQLMIK